MATTVWKGHLTFGLVSIPVRLFKAARPAKISFHQLRKGPVAKPAQEPEPARVPQPIRGAVPIFSAPPVREPAPAPDPETYTRVRQQLVAPEPDGTERESPVPRSEIVKGYEYEKDRYVVVSEEELKELTPKTATEMQILEFVELAEVDPIYYETSYYVAPDEAGERPYALLLAAMRASGYVALAEVAMHRREHIMLIRPGSHGLIAHTMFYAAEIRADQEYHADTRHVNPRELELAKRLIESLKGKFEPAKYTDKFKEKLQAMIDAHIAGKEVAQASPTPKAAPAIDILEALKASLQQVKKPVASEQGAKTKRGRSSRAVR
jgi:DNA end-binding protein Ku